MSKVYFTDLRTTPKRNLLDKVVDLMNRTKIDTKIRQNDLVAVKLHFGEAGNTTYIRPIFLRSIVRRLKQAGGKPFLTDTNTLYTGSRSDTVNHLTTAIQNGFDYSCIEAPLVIADGLRGMSGTKIPLEGEVLKEVVIAKEIADADAMVVITHFKAHELSGFGGSLKNMGMGCATREGKLVQHSTVAPKINQELCKGCKLCQDYCPSGAIWIEGKKASIAGETCIGCGECILICPSHAIEVQWNEHPDVFQKKMMEYAAGALKNKENKSLFINFVVQVSPACDCYPHSDAPIVCDIGILASDDPVAVDQASCDMVNNEVSLPGTAIKNISTSGEDKWRALYPRIDWSVQLDHAQKLGLGSRKYTLQKI